MKPSHLEPINALNPADYFTLAMDEEIRREKMPGSLCGYGLMLDRLPDVALLTAKIAELTAQCPLILARLQPHRQRFYWCRSTAPQPVFFQQQCQTDEPLDRFLKTTTLALLNQHQPRKLQAPMTFHLLQHQEGALLLLRWLHPFCDAKGVGIILKYLCTDAPTERAQFDFNVTTSLVDDQLAKYSFWQKLKWFIKAKRYIGRLDQYRSIQHAQLGQPPKHLNACTYTLSVEESLRVAQQARNNTGLTGTSLYYIGCLMRALNQLAPEQVGEAYCVPYAFNLRKQNALTPVLGNHVGALFAQAPKPLLAHRDELFKHLKEQAMQTVRQQLDYAFLPVMWAASWLSLKKYGSELRHSHGDGSERSSAWFSDVGHIDFPENGLCGADITGVRHFCQISSPPGFALLACQYRQQLTLSYNFIEPLFDEAGIARLHQYMIAELLQ